MSKYLFRAVIFVFIAIATHSPVSAESIDFFQSTAKIYKNGSFDVEEKITYTFDNNKHGILRKIPISVGNGKGLTIELNSVKDESGKPYKTSIIDGYVYVIRVGDPDKTIDGTHVYIINYSVKGGIRYFDKYDEFYWNVFGSEWDFAFTNGLFVLDASELGVKPQEISCYTGYLGTRGEHKCQINNNAILLQSEVGNGKDMTVSFTFPKGYISELLPRDISRISVDDRELSKTDMYILFLIGSVCSLPFFVIFLVYLRQYLNNRITRPVYVSYDPPSDLSVYDIGRIIDARFDGSEIAATILEQAIRGAIVITEKKKNFFKNQEYLFTIKDMNLLSEDGKSIFTYMSLGSHILENKQMLNLLTNNTVIDTENSSIDYTEFSSINSKNLENLIKKGIFKENSTKTGMQWLTDVGREYKANILGFKKFLETVDERKYLVLTEDLTQITYEKHLPYAVLFGVEKEWIKHFDHVTITQPNWYVGVNFNSTVFGSNFSNYFSSGSVSVSSSNSSGSGGGGYSGGGGGGGGGGSW